MDEREKIKIDEIEFSEEELEAMSDEELQEAVDKLTEINNIINEKLKKNDRKV